MKYFISFVFILLLNPSLFSETFTLGHLSEAAAESENADTENYEDSFTLEEQELAVIQIEIGDHYFQKADGGDNLDRARFWYKIAARNSDTRGIKSLVKTFDIDGSSVYGEREAFKWIKKGAELGDPTMTSLLCYFYENGLGTEADIGSAFFWAKTAALSGSAYDQYVLGEYFLYGKGVPSDLDAAVFWFAKSHESGYPRAAYTLGLLYSDGDKIDRSPSLSISWFTKGAVSGDVDSMAELGYLYLYGVDGLIEIDYEKSLRWFKVAALKGSAIGAVNAGTIYLNGGGEVKKDLEKAAVWFKKGVYLGDSASIYYLAKMKCDSGNIPECASLFYAAPNIMDVFDIESKHNLSSYAL